MSDIAYWIRQHTAARSAEMEMRRELDRVTKERDEAQQVCAEAYQVVGSMLDDLGQFNTDRATKVLDNLSQRRMVHRDVLPWPSFEAAKGPLANTPKNRLIRSAIAQIEEQNLSKWSDDHDRVTLNALREYLSVWGDRG